MSTAPAVLQDFHPLELIPFFRRWPCGFWRDLVYTFVWNTLLAALFSVLALLWVGHADWSRVVWLNFVYAQLIGYTIHALYLLGHAVVPRVRLGSRPARVLFYAGIPVVGVVIGCTIGHWATGTGTLPGWALSWRGLIALALNSLVITGILLAVMLPRERAAQAQARLAAAERQTALAQLKALEAQVEPHFLYNTLAHVVSLVDSEPAAARRMLDRLIALLRSRATPDASSTLGAQASLLSAYLEILALRMGDRLRWTIEVPDSLAAIALPPALLQPLVENAVKHGLEPMIDGGSIDVVARDVGGVLELSVSDTGGGFGTSLAPIGGSTQRGLAVLKQRLSALYGDRATFTLAENAPSGVRATLRVPLEVPA